MSIEIMSAVWRTPLKSNTQKLVLLSLADQANSHGVCWPSMRHIAERCDMAERTVFEQVKALKEAGFLTVQSGGGTASNRYTITVSTPAPNAGLPLRHDPNTPAPRSEAPLRHDPTIPKDESKVKPKEEGAAPTPPIQKASPRIVFRKPTIEEVKTFCVLLGLPESDGESFFWGKEANGWRNGNAAIKDWRATVRQWKASGYHPSQKQNGGRSFAARPSRLAAELPPEQDAAIQAMIAARRAEEAAAEALAAGGGK
jgi:hypothetical protein